MSNIYLRDIEYYNPYHIFNPSSNHKLSQSMIIPNNRNYLMNNFSQLGYQIMNPQYMNYQLEPIYSPSLSSIQVSKPFSYKKIPQVEIGEPIGRDSNDNNYKYNYGSTNLNKSQIIPMAEKVYKNSDTQLILDAINKLQQSANTKRDIINSCSTKDNTNHFTKLNSYNSKEYKKPPIKLTENISPFINYSIDSYSHRKKYLQDIDKLNKNRNKTKLDKFERSKNRLLLKNLSKEDWMKLFKQFVYLYIFWSSAKKYSNKNSRKRKSQILFRTKHIVNDISILKDWVIYIEESFFNEFRYYKQFNYELNIQSQGEKKQIIKKQVLNIIKIFIENLESSLDDLPLEVQTVLKEYIKQESYFPKKYLSKFQINRIDFNFYGGTKNLTTCQGAMILSYLIINGVSVQQILLHIRDVFTEYSDFYEIDRAAKNIGSILHYLVRDIFKKKQKKINDILALFNYYRNYHLYNEQIEQLKDKINKKINIEENENEDEYNASLLSYREVKDFFKENNKYIDEFKEGIYNWSIELVKKIKINENFSASSYKNKNKIKSSIHG